MLQLPERLYLFLKFDESVRVRSCAAQPDDHPAINVQLTFSSININLLITSTHPSPSLGRRGNLAPILTALVRNVQYRSAKLSFHSLNLNMSRRRFILNESKKSSTLTLSIFRWICRAAGCSFSSTFKCRTRRLVSYDILLSPTISIWKKSNISCHCISSALQPNLSYK